MGIVALLWKYSSHPFSPDFLDCGEDAQVVINQYIVICWKAVFHIIEFPFLMDVDKHVSTDRFGDAGACDLARLKYDIAIRQYHRLAPLLHLLHHVDVV